MSKLAQLASDSSIDRVSMAFNNVSGQPALQSANGQGRDTPVNMLQQQNMPFEVLSPPQRSSLSQQQQQHQPQQQQHQQQYILSYQQQQQQIQQHFSQQLQQLQILQNQLREQENNPQQSQAQLPYTSQQIATARQSLMTQQHQQLAMLAQRYQMQLQQAQAQAQAQVQAQVQLPSEGPHAVNMSSAAPIMAQVAYMPSAGGVATTASAQTHTGSVVAAVPPAANVNTNVSEDSKGHLGSEINGNAGASSPASNIQPPTSVNLAMLRETAAKFGLPESAFSRFTAGQLQLFLNNLQAQQAQQQQQQSSNNQSIVSSAVNALTPQRQMSDSMLHTGSNGNSTPTKGGGGALRSKSARPKKSVAQDRSKSGSPAPNLNQTQSFGNPQLFSPTAMHAPHQSLSVLGSPIGAVNSPHSMGNHNTIQRKGSMTSVAADDIRATPTPSESSIGGPIGSQLPVVTYTAEEIANAHKKSEEFVRQLSEFTSESFLEFLQKFLKENNFPGNFNKTPVFADRHIDLYRFFCEVVRQGGLEQVHTRKIWRQVAKDSGLPDIPTLPPLLSRWYKVWLQPLEQLAVFPPGHPKHTGVNANFSLKKRRKHDPFGSPGSTPGPSERPYSVNPESSKRPKMYSPITNGAASATASPAQFTPPPPMPISSSAMHLPTGPIGTSSVQNSSTTSLQTNGFTPTSIRTLPPHMPVPIGHAQPGVLGSTSGTVPNPAIMNASMAHMQSLQMQYQLQKQHGEISGPQQPSIPLITVPAPPPAPQSLQFFPLERTLDTYGGVNIQEAVTLRPQVRLPSVGEYGFVDIRALALSIESGIVMEVTTALNTLVQITSQSEVVVPLRQCEELAETLFSILESVKLPATHVGNGQDQDEAPSDVSPGKQTAEPADKPDAKRLSYSDEADLFSELYMNDLDEGGIIGDDMQDPTSVCGLIHGNDDLWAFTSDRTLTVMYALRNLSFSSANQQFLSTSSDFFHMFRTVLEKCDRAVSLAREWCSNMEDARRKLFGRIASLIVFRALEFRKSLMVMLVNVADRIDLQAAGREFADAVLQLVYYFIDEKQTSDVVEEWVRESLSPAGAVMSDALASTAYVQAFDGRTYYLHALEAIGRLTVSDNNRECLGGTFSPDAYWPLANTCISIISGNQAAVSLNAASKQNFTENRLMWVQMALVVFSNLVCIVTPQPLVALRRYTPFRILPSGVVGGSAPASGIPSASDGAPKVNGVGAGLSFVGGSRRARMRCSLPFVPVVYTATAVPIVLKRFRRRLVDNDDVVRTLFEMVFMWWMHVGAAANLRTNQTSFSPQVVHDSPLNDIAERAVYVLQQLHPEHDSLFTARWSEWVMERATRVPLCSELMEVLYELTGMMPVQSLSYATKPDAS